MSAISHDSAVSKSGMRRIGYLLLVMLSGSLCTQSMAGEAQDVYNSIPAVDCVINPYQVADLASPVPGVIEQLLVERSQQVSAGQVLAQLDAGVERANVELALYRAGIQSELNLGRINLQYDKRRRQRVDSLYEKKVISVENTDEAEREADLSRWKLEQAEEQANIRKLELQRAREQLNQKSIRAPFDGYVLDTFKYRGEYVEDQAILRLAQLDPLVIEAIVPMENFGKIDVGMMAEIVPDFVSDEKLKARVTIVDRIGDTASNTFGVRLVLPNPENRIPAGLKCVAKFLQRTEQQSVPATVTERTVVPAAVTASLNDELPEDGSSAIEQPAQNLKEARHAGYLVVSDEFNTDQQTQALIKRLREAGIDDLQQMYSGLYKGRVMLGHFSSLVNAQKRRQLLTELGIAAFIHEWK
jgi:RND family efflux transporter MFP subunit